MSDRYFFGYKVNTDIKHLLPITVLFTRNDEKITVAMAQDAVNYIVGVLARYKPLIENPRSRIWPTVKSLIPKHKFFIKGSL